MDAQVINPKQVRIVKLCALVDYIEIILPVVLKKPGLDSQVTCLIIEMSGLFENERITKLLLDFNLFSVILDVIES